MGFKKTSSLVNQLTQKSFEKRGFSQAKLILNWKEIVGSELVEVSRPSKISFFNGMLGATLTIEIDGAFRPELDLQKNVIKERVNRVYGYMAITGIKFKMSPYLGYSVSARKKLQINETSDDEQKVSINSSAHTLKKIIPKLKYIKDDKLKNSLTTLSANFIKIRK